MNRSDVLIDTDATPLDALLDTGVSPTAFRSKLRLTALSILSGIFAKLNPNFADDWKETANSYEYSLA